MKLHDSQNKQLANRLSKTRGFLNERLIYRLTRQSIFFRFSSSDNLFVDIHII